MKKRYGLVVIAVVGLSIPPVQAGGIPPTNVGCWFFRGDNPGIQQGCTYESHTWLGGGASTLQRWDKTAKATMAWGLQGRGEKLCEDTSLDDVCGSRYFRDAKTLRRISSDEGMRLGAHGQKVVECVQTQKRSVCWLRHSSLD